MLTRSSSTDDCVDVAVIEKRIRDVTVLCIAIPSVLRGITQI